MQFKFGIQWNGRIFNQNGKCGAKGEGCTVTEFNLDTGSQFTPQVSSARTSFFENLEA